MPSPDRSDSEAEFHRRTAERRGIPDPEGSLRVPSPAVLEAAMEALREWASPRWNGIVWSCDQPPAPPLPEGTLAELPPGGFAEIIQGPGRRFVGRVVRHRPDGAVDVVFRVPVFRLSPIPADQVLVFPAAVAENVESVWHLTDTPPPEPLVVTANPA